MIYLPLLFLLDVSFMAIINTTTQNMTATQKLPIFIVGSYSNIIKTPSK
jgi:hypothetical protein